MKRNRRDFWRKTLTVPQVQGIYEFRSKKWRNFRVKDLMLIYDLYIKNPNMTIEEVAAKRGVLTQGIKDRITQLIGYIK